MWYRNYSCGDCVHCDLNERNRYDNSKAYCSISECIKNDPKREAIAETYFLNYIQPICEMLKTGKPLTAIEKYKEMVNELKVFYNIHDVEYDENEKVTGKGYLLKR